MAVTGRATGRNINDAVMNMELISLAKNPVPSGARCGTFKSYDGAPLRFAIWQASRGPRRGTVCLFGGRTEYVEKYFEVVADLRRRGLAVATMDWRGQGGSFRALTNRRKGHINDYSEFDRDLLRFMRDIVLPDCPPPYTGLAHSMGGNILLRASTMSGSWFDRMVLSSPMVRLAREGLPASASTARLLSEIIGRLGFSHLYPPGVGDRGWEDEPFEGNVLTSSKERYSRNQAIIARAPELGLGGPTVGWLRASLRSMAEIATPQFARSTKVPLLLIAAGDDRVVSSRAIEDFVVRVKVGTHVVIPHARHEIMQERNELRQQFWAAFDAYVGCSQ